VTQEPPDTQHLFVPLREAAHTVSLRLFRDRDGTRCAVAFTTHDQLTSVLGSEQRYYRLTGRAVRSLVAERGVDRLIVDPGLVAAPVSPTFVPQLPTSSLDPAQSPASSPTLSPAPAMAPALSSAASTSTLTPTSGRVRAGWNPQLVGLLTVSAVTGAAALLMQVIQ
jgi:SseB protein N-terminal domain